MSTYYKEGTWGRLSPQMRRGKGKLASLYKSKGLNFLVTSKMDGNHSASSCHPEGDAIDFKRQGVPKIDITEILDMTLFDVVEYRDKRDIFHVEYDPDKEKK